MEKINNFLNQIYGNKESMMNFYLILGVLALFFIILIIVTLIKSGKEEKKKRKTVPEIENDKESNDEEEINENKLTETQIFNKILMSDDYKEEAPKEQVELKEETKETTKEVIEQRKENQSNLDEPNVYLEKEEVSQNANEFNSKEEEKSISELMDDKPMVESIKVDDIVETSKPIKEDYTIEMPKVKPMDLDDYLFRREKEEFNINKPEDKETEKTIENETIGDDTPKPVNVKKIEFSNDELKERLAKLKIKEEETSSKNNEDEIPDADLENLMKAVGLEDTTIIPEINDQESHILGR